MIPYEDLVAALAAWRTRQGLPVAQLAAPPPPPPRAAAPAPPPRVAAPAPATTRATGPRAVPPPPPASTSSSNDDFEDEAGLVEDGQYASAGDDYVVPLGGDMVEQAGESTAIGDAPEPPSAGLTRRGKRNHDW